MVTETSKNSGGKPHDWEQRVVRYGGWSLGALMTFLLFGIFFGQHFPGFFGALGLDWLYHQESGVYADCSKGSNRNNPYCIQKSRGDGGWRDLKDTKGERTGFSLH